MTCLTCQAVSIADEDGLHRLVVTQRRALDLAGNEVLALNIELRQARERISALEETVGRLNAHYRSATSEPEVRFVRDPYDPRRSGAHVGRLPRKENP